MLSVIGAAFFLLNFRQIIPSYHTQMTIMRVLYNCFELRLYAPKYVYWFSNSRCQASIEVLTTGPTYPFIPEIYVHSQPWGSSTPCILGSPLLISTTPRRYLFRISFITFLFPHHYQFWLLQFLVTFSSDRCCIVPGGTLVNPLDGRIAMG